MTTTQSDRLPAEKNTLLSGLQRILLRNLLAMAAIVAVVATLMSGLIFFTDSYEHRRLLRDYAIRLDAGANARLSYVQEQIDLLRNDALFISSVPPVGGMVRAGLNGGFDTAERTPGALWQHRLETIFLAYATANHRLTEIRFIAVADHGRELVHVDRVDGKVMLVSPRLLQSVDQKDYFRATEQLVRGQTYVSELNLSREFGTVKVPYKPTLRASTPVFGPDGRLFGMIVVNLDAGQIFQVLQANLITKFRLYLTNSRGDYLINPNPGLTFGFDLGKPRRWQDDFVPVSGSEDSGARFHDYLTAAGVVHSVEGRIALDQRDPSRYLTLAMVLPEPVVAAEVASFRNDIMLFAAIGGGLAGLMFLAYQRWISRLTARQQRLAALVEGANDAMICKTLDGVVTDWNPAAERIFGYSRDEAIGRTVAALIVPPESQWEEREILASVGRGQAVPHFHTRRRRKDGTVLDVSVMVSPLYSSQGYVVGASKIVRDISEQIVTARDLAEAQERLVFATQAGGIGLWEYELSSDTLRYDDTMLALYGLSRDSFGGNYEAWKSSLHPDDAAAALQAINDARDHGTPISTSYRIVTPAGEVRHVRSKATMLYDDAGHPLRMLGVNFDITDEKDKESQIEELNANLEQQVIARTTQIRTLTALQQSILADAAFPIITTDISGTITLFNPAAEEMLGYRAEEVVGKASPVIFHDPAEMKARAAALSADLGIAIEPDFTVFTARLQQGVTQEGEWTYVRKDGTRLTVLLTASVLRGDQDQPFGYLGMVLDLSERRRYEQELLDREHFLRSITDNLPAMISYWDIDLACRFANDRYGTWFNKTVDEMSGIYLGDLVRGAQSASVLAHAQAALAGDAQQFELLLPRVDGTDGYAMCHFVPDREGTRIRGFYALGWDVTELRQAQIDLESLNGRLEARTREAEAATTSKSQFLANMSHEIRSPMNAILGMLQLLSTTSLSPRQADYASKALSATQSLLHLLNDILDFSKIEAGKMTLEAAPFSIDAMMRDVSTLIAASAGRKPVELVFAIDRHIPPGLRGDSFRLRQVLLNLAGNAVKFTAEGEVVVSIRRIAHTSDRSTLEFSVTDTGIGISPEQVTAIFEGFNQAESSTTRRYGGTGLGLAICQRLVALMGGRLEVASELGSGSRFHFTLEFEHAEPPVDAVLPQFPGLTAPERAKRVLVVDDNEHARDSLMNMVLSLGWECDCAASGDEALAMIRQSGGESGYDVIFMDWIMPGWDGWETSRRVRAYLPPEQIPIIVMVTAHGREEAAGRAQTSPEFVSGVLTKPVTASMLLDSVTEAAAQGRAPAPQQRAHPGARRLVGMKLLVVDDTPVNQQVSFELLSNEGAFVEVADSGREAVEQVLRADPLYDAVLMDVQMPDMDGYEATRILRQYPELRDLPIIAMTANAMVSDKIACLDAGMNDHIAKPININVVVRTILANCRGPLALPRDADLGTPETTPSPSLIDLDLAIERLGNNRAFFVKIGNQFLRDCGMMMTELREFVRAEATAPAMALLHKLKGLAGTLGNRPFAEVAAHLESALREKGRLYEPDSDLDLLQSLLDSGNTALEAEIIRFDEAQSARRPTAEAIDPASVETTFNELDALLQEANMRAVSVCAGLQQQVGSDFAERLLPMVEAIDRLDFRRARDVLSSIRSSFP